MGKGRAERKCFLGPGFGFGFEEGNGHGGGGEGGGGGIPGEEVLDQVPEGGGVRRVHALRRVLGGGRLRVRGFPGLRRAGRPLP